MRAHVDFGAGVGVVPPRASDPERRLVNGERVDAGLLHLHARRDPTEPGTDHRHPRCPRGTEQLFGGGLHARSLSWSVTDDIQTVQNLVSSHAKLLDMRCTRVIPLGRALLPRAP